MQTKRIGQRLTVSDQMCRNIEFKNRPLAIESRLRFNPGLSIKRLFGLEANANLGRRAADVFDTKGFLSPKNHKLKIFTPRGFELDIKTLTGLNAKEIDAFASEKDEQVKRTRLLEAFKDQTDDNGDDTNEFKNAKEELESDQVLKADQIFMLLAVEQWARALEYASPELREDKDFILKAVSLHGEALQYASTELKADITIVLAAVKQTWRALRFASEELKTDKTVCKAAAQQKHEAGSHTIVSESSYYNASRYGRM